MARGDRTASELSQRSAKHEGVDQKEGEERRQLETRSVPAAPTFELSTQTHSHTAVHASSTWWTDVSEIFLIFFSIITLCIFSEAACTARFYVRKDFVKSARKTQSENTSVRRPAVTGRSHRSEDKQVHFLCIQKVS